MKNIADEKPLLKEDSQEYAIISQFISDINQTKHTGVVDKIIKSKFFSFSIVIFTATLFGFLSIFNYLKEIDNLSLFPDILTNFHSFIAILFYPLIILITLIYFFLIPCTIYFIDKIITFKWDYERNRKIQSSIRKLFYANLVWIIIIILMIIFVYNNINYWSFFLLIPFILTNLWSFDIKLKEDYKIAGKVFLYFLIHTLFSLIAFITALIVIWKLLKSTLLILVILLLLVIFYIIIGQTVISDVKVVKSIKKEKVIGLGFISVFCAVMFIYIISIINSNIAKQSLQAIRFIESPKNSSWYIIYNNAKFNNFTFVNGLTSKEIGALKQEFYNRDSTSHENICNENENEKCNYHANYIMNENALYGYMAWNLGQTKVFCPDNVDNFLKNIKKEDVSKCLVINGNNLQIIDENYID